MPGVVVFLLSQVSSAHFTTGVIFCVLGGAICIVCALHNCYHWRLEKTRADQGLPVYDRCGTPPPPLSLSIYLSIPPFLSPRLSPLLCLTFHDLFYSFLPTLSRALLCPCLSLHPLSGISALVPLSVLWVPCACVTITLCHDVKIYTLWIIG